MPGRGRQSGPGAARPDRRDRTGEWQARNLLAAGRGRATCDVALWCAPLYVRQSLSSASPCAPQRNAQPRNDARRRVWPGARARAATRRGAVRASEPAIPRARRAAGDGFCACAGLRHRHMRRSGACAPWPDLSLAGEEQRLRRRPGSLRTLNGRVVSVEGGTPPKNVALVEWDSVDALAFYKSKAWTDLAPQRDKSQKTIRRYVVEVEK